MMAKKRKKGQCAVATAACFTEASTTYFPNGNAFKNSKYQAGPNRGLCPGQMWHRTFKHTVPLKPAMHAYGNGEVQQQQRGQPWEQGRCTTQTHTPEDTREQTTHTIGQASQLPQSANTAWYLIHRPRWPTAVHSHSCVVHIPHLYRSRRSSSACPCLIDSSVYRFGPSIAPSPVLSLSILPERSTNPNSFRLTA